ncbi:hypothetical protein [Streptomyces griseus]|uniref:hypothetical protein n=1 Tax=Streptomyces griseus TaxID=1911 RepID=UPI003799172B
MPAGVRRDDPRQPAERCLRPRQELLAEPGINCARIRRSGVAAARAARPAPTSTVAPAWRARAASSGSA